MSNIRIRVCLNEGRRGVPLHKFSQVVSELDKFLIMVGEKIGVQKESNKWLTYDFANGSGIFTNELAAVVEVERRNTFNRTIEAILELKAGSPHDEILLPIELLVQYSKVTAPLDIDELVNIGLFDDDESTEPRWIKSNKLQIESALNEIEKEAVYIGSILGATHLLNKGADDPYFQIRDIVTGYLIKCIYDRSDYSRVAALFQKQDSLVYVRGLVKADLISKRVVEVNADDFEVAPGFNSDDLEKFIGRCPRFTGDLSTTKFVTRARTNG